LEARLAGDRQLSAVALAASQSVAVRQMFEPRRVRTQAIPVATMAESPARVAAPEVPVTDEVPEVVDELAESAFRAEARERGETIASVPVRTAETEEKGPLPPLDSLVQRIPADVRETLEDLFRAKFVTVRHVPAKALKQK
jgi:hypothetical protein